MATTLIDSVLHWRKKLDKDPDDDYILNVIRKLSKIPMTLEILEVTHIGKTIRNLSKRDGIVGEKAKTVLNKWRGAFSSQESDKSQKLSNLSKKENVNKERKSSNKQAPDEKTVHSHKKVSHNHEHKHKNDSVSLSLSEQSSKKYANGSYNTNNYTESSHSLYKYEVKERSLDYMDYDPHAEGSEGYNPECPELFPSDKPAKTKKPILVETYEPSSLKRKLTDEKGSHSDKTSQKKSKSDSYLISNQDSVAETKKSHEKKHKHDLNKEKSKDNSHSSSLKSESNKMKSHQSVKKETASDAKKVKCKESSESEGTKSKKTKVKIHTAEEFTSSEVSFEDCLGFNDIVSLSKSSKSHSSSKKQSSNNVPSKEKPTEKSKKDPQKITSTHQKTKVSKDSSSNTSKTKISKDSSLNTSKSKVSKGSSHNKEIPFVVPKPATKLDVADITFNLPEIQPNYRPLPRSPEFYSPKKKEVLTNEDAIKFTSSRREKTAVYSGRKTGSYYTEVPTLYEICIRILCENIDAIECVGDASYEMMRPILERCTPSQLYNIENYNPNFLDNTDHLWEIHCKRDYKLLKPVEHETWRELYWRAHDERERKLKSVTANISALMSKSTPVRQVKLAYVDTHAYVKPPRDVARRQAKHGTAAPVNHTVKSGSPSKPIPRPSAPAVSSTATSSITTSISAPKSKPKIAPLMAKTLKSMKAFRRK